MPHDIPTDPIEFRAWRDATVYRLAMRASRAERAATLDGLHALGWTGVTLTDTTLLANLDDEGTSITGLARRAGTTRQAASQHVLRLEREGYVIREADSFDARAMRVHRTDRGRALLQDALGIVVRLEAEYEEILGAHGIAELKRLLTKLLAEIDPGGALGPE